MYRSENSKLKYVLEVVNFFGRSDTVSMVRLDKGEAAKFVTQHFFGPMPVWTRIGDDFHAYSSHWHKHPFIAGGEVVTIVIGLQRSPVKFRCSLNFPSGPVTGLFSYTRVELTSSPVKDTEHYHVYKFMCKVNKDFGPKGPQVIVFHDIQTGSAEHFMHIHNLSQPPSTSPPLSSKQNENKGQPVTSKSSVAACVDFIPYNITKSADSQSNAFTDKQLFEFFLHHAIVGIQDFIVYEMNNFPTHAYDILQHQGIRITRLPFNFPYELGDASKIRGILELDCLLRTSAQIKFVMLLRMNEFFQPTSNVRLNRTFVQSLEQHPDNINRYELHLQTVCENESTGRGMRSDLHFYDADARSDHPVLVYRPTYELLDVKSIEVTAASGGLVHRYSKHCTPNSMKDWRQTITAEHSRFLAEVAQELKGLLV